MKRRCRHLFLMTGLCLSLLGASSSAQAQRSEFQGLRRNMATVIFSGLGGAVLGLSTLSFYGQPQEHTGNIYAGLGLGLVLGTVYVLSVDSGGDSLAMYRSQQGMQLAEFKEIRTRPLQQNTFPIAAYAWTF